MTEAAAPTNGQETPIYDEVRTEQHFDPSTMGPTEQAAQ